MAVCCFSNYRYAHDAVELMELWLSSDNNEAMSVSLVDRRLEEAEAISNCCLVC